MRIRSLLLLMMLCLCGICACSAGEKEPTSPEGSPTSSSTSSPKRSRNSSPPKTHGPSSPADLSSAPATEEVTWFGWLRKVPEAFLTGLNKVLQVMGAQVEWVLALLNRHTARLQSHVARVGLSVQAM